MSDILDVPMRRKSYTRIGDHLFEKPVALMERLINKHTFPGELVVEPFGATGPASQAAVRTGRHWLYCESNPRNFELGSRRIMALQEQVSKKQIA